MVSQLRGAPTPAEPRARTGELDAIPQGGPARAAIRRGRGALGLLTLDVAALALATLVAYVLRQGLPWLGSAGDLSEHLQAASWIIGVGWLAAIWMFGGYDVRLLPSGPDLFRNVLHASFGAAGIVGAFLYLTGEELSRAFFLVLFVLGPVLLVLSRLLVRRVLNQARDAGRFRRDVLVVGALPNVDGIAGTLARETWLGYDVIGAVIPHRDPRRTSARGIPVLGTEDDLLALVRRERPAVLLFVGGSSTAEDFRRTAWMLEDADVDLIVVPSLSEISRDRVRMRPVAGLPLVHLDRPRSRQAVRRSKRVFDVAASAVLLVALAPLMVAIAMTVMLHDGGPVIFRQERVGHGGRSFEFLKFRSMVPDAEERLAAIRATAQDRGNDVLFKAAEDPRVTRPGRILRRYSLDELPQLWNVLRGDMSLVGPRPALPQEVTAYDEDARRRLTVRPGITGLWQVSGRSDLSWTDTVRLDLYYVDNWSFTQDAQILLRTLRAVLAPSGAY